jgi:peptidoglycan hydrolase-like protein with peptidoglycan-binding domain
MSLGSAQRDLASRDVWSHSLERSHERRARAGIRPPVTAVELLPAHPRDLTDPDVWQRSSWRAKARREAASTELEFRTPSPRGMSLAALLAMVGVPAVSLGAGLVDAPAAEAKPAVRHSGGGVRKLQRALGIPADGVFGPQTAKALKRWQRRHGLTADGIAGPATRSALGIGRGPVLKRKGGGHKRRAHRAASHRGGGVAALQRALGIGSDGVFGPQTERALKRWQARHGLSADGVAGPATRRALGLGPGRLLKRGGRGGGGGGSSVIQRVIAAGNRIAYKPYRYGGGHGSFRDSGYDCSGSVSYALHGGGLLGRPRDSSGFMSYGRPGRGRHITIYANPGHVYMVVNGRRFDTSARSSSGSRWTGRARSSAGYVVRHPAGL